MGPRRTTLAVLALAAFAVALSACGAGNTSEGLISNIDKARSARTLTSLQQGLITVQTASADGGASSAPALAAELQQRDPSNRYTTAPPTDVGVVQVIGGGGSPIMLVGVNSPPGSPRPPYYLAVWESAGSTMFYLGQQPPQYTATAPSTAGWSSSPPIA
jgi:predicted small secreted protein